MAFNPQTGSNAEAPSGEEGSRKEGSPQGSLMELGLDSRPSVLIQCELPSGIV